MSSSVPAYVTKSLGGAALAAATSSMYLGRDGMEALVAALATVGGEYIAVNMIKASSGTMYHIEEALAQGGLVFLADFFAFGHGDVVAAGIVALAAVGGNYLAAKVQVGGQTLDGRLASAL